MAAIWRILAILAAIASVSGLARAQDRVITPDVAQAMQDLWAGRATTKQRALLFKNNDAINAAAMQGWVPDSVYQQVQSDYAALNRHFASEAAREAGAGFEVQKSKSQTYTPGTDSDYITKVTRPEQIGQMQSSYNRRINAFLAENEVLDAPSDTWHNKLDTDFMADPNHVTKAEFEQIAKMNNDAYKRREAAIFEAKSRDPDAPPITPQEYHAYAQEMQDFAAKKQGKMERWRNDPTLLNDPLEQAEYHRMMAQEQKYIERIENANRILREQQGLGPMERPGGPRYEVVETADGNYAMREIEEGPSISKRGSRRNVDAYFDTVNASVMADHVMNRALGDLSASIAEAAQVNPEFRAQAAAQIADLTSEMTPAQRGQ
ncbi:MAG: hypothetical protein D6773_07340, partial [Alphaproteobacteria bacterium]